MISNIHYRTAQKDDAHSIAKLMLPAFGELAEKFTNSNNKAEAIRVFEHFCNLQNNIYSYENIIVAIENNNVVAAINCYDGAKFESLRLPFLQYIKANYGVDSQIENETSVGEFYIDMVSVEPQKRGQGIGSYLIRKAIERAKTEYHKTVGLLVEHKNPDAKKLYENIGFTSLDTKIIFGIQFEHLVFAIK